METVETQVQVLAGSVKAEHSSLSILDSCQHVTLSEAGHWFSVKEEIFHQQTANDLDRYH